MRLAVAGGVCGLRAVRQAGVAPLPALPGGGEQRRPVLRDVRTRVRAGLPVAGPGSSAAACSRLRAPAGARLRAPAAPAFAPGYGGAPAQTFGPPQGFGAPVERVVGAIPEARIKTGMFSSDMYVLVVTERRLLGAKVTSDLLKRIIEEARAAKKAEGGGFFAQWGAQIGASVTLGKRYAAMAPEAILAETPGNWALDASGVREIRVQRVDIGDDETVTRHTLRITIETVGRKAELQHGHGEPGPAGRGGVALGAVPGPGALSLPGAGSGGRLRGRGAVRFEISRPARGRLRSLQASSLSRGSERKMATRAKSPRNATAVVRALTNVPVEEVGCSAPDQVIDEQRDQEEDLAPRGRAERSLSRRATGTREEPGRAADQGEADPPGERKQPGHRSDQRRPRPDVAERPDPPLAARRVPVSTSVQAAEIGGRAG